MEGGDERAGVKSGHLFERQLANARSERRVPRIVRVAVVGRPCPRGWMSVSRPPSSGLRRRRRRRAARQRTRRNARAQRNGMRR
jgi:hypothetical protein